MITVEAFDTVYLAHEFVHWENHLVQYPTMSEFAGETTRWWSVFSCMVRFKIPAFSWSIAYCSSLCVSFSKVKIASQFYSTDIFLRLITLFAVEMSHVLHFCRIYQLTLTQDNFPFPVVLLQESSKVSKVGDRFSIATTPRRSGRRYSIPWIAPLYPWSLPYNAAN